MWFLSKLISLPGIWPSVLVGKPLVSIVQWAIQY
jgi:hypothetical protein